MREKNTILIQFELQAFLLEKALVSNMEVHSNEVEELHNCKAAQLERILSNLTLENVQRLNLTFVRFMIGQLEVVLKNHGHNEIAYGRVNQGGFGCWNVETGIGGSKLLRVEELDVLGWRVRGEDVAAEKFKVCILEDW